MPPYLFLIFYDLSETQALDTKRPVASHAKGDSLTVADLEIPKGVFRYACSQWSTK